MECSTPALIGDEIFVPGIVAIHSSIFISRFIGRFKGRIVDKREYGAKSNEWCLAREARCGKVGDPCFNFYARSELKFRSKFRKHSPKLIRCVSFV